MADTVVVTDMSPAVTEARAGWRRRLAPWVALLGLVLLMLGAWSAAPALLLRISPAVLVFPDDAPAATVDQFNGPQGAYVVGYDHDSYVHLDIELTSVGPVDLTLEDVRLGLQGTPLLVPVEPSGSITMPAGEQATATVGIRFDNCEAYHEREAMVVDHVRVTARVLGRQVVEHVTLDRPLMARSPMLWQCPDRTLDRADDRR